MPAPSVPSDVGVDRLIADARSRLGGLGGQVEELLRFREQLKRTARELEDEYSRVLARIGAPAAPPGPSSASAAAVPAPALPPAGPLRGPIASPLDQAVVLPDHPIFATPPEPAPAPPARVPEPAPAGTEPQPIASSQAAPPAPPAPPAGPPPPSASPAPVASTHDDAVFEGGIVLDAGPFTDIAALSAFEQGLGRVPGAEDVYVSGFQGNRALVELRLSLPIALVQEMRAVLPGGFTVTDAEAGRLRVDIHAIASGS